MTPIFISFYSPSTARHWHYTIAFVVLAIKVGCNLKSVLFVIQHTTYYKVFIIFLFLFRYKYQIKIEKLCVINHSCIVNQLICRDKVFCEIINVNSIFSYDCRTAHKPMFARKFNRQQQQIIIIVLKSDTCIFKLFEKVPTRITYL